MNNVSTKTSLDLNELFTKLLFLIQSGFYEYGYCSFYIASSGGNSIEIFANDKTLFKGNDAACKKVFKELLKRLKKQDYRITGDKEYLTIRRNI